MPAFIDTPCHDIFTYAHIVIVSHLILIRYILPATTHVYGVSYITLSFFIAHYDDIRFISRLSFRYSHYYFHYAPMLMIHAAPYAISSLFVIFADSELTIAAADAAAIEEASHGHAPPMPLRHDMEAITILYADTMRCHYCQPYCFAMMILRPLSD